MAKNIPFFDMFSELQHASDLRLKLNGAELSGASIDQGNMTIVLNLLTRFPLTESDQKMVQDAIGKVYGFRSVTLNIGAAEPPKPMAAAEPSGKSGAKPTGKVIFGNAIKGKSVPMKELSLKMGSATVTGKVFAFECRETRRPGMWRLSFDMTDYTNSVTVQKNLMAKEAQALESAIKPGMWLTVKGKMEPTWDGKDIQLSPFDINTA